jgi:hypothetical protein
MRALRVALLFFISVPVFILVLGESRHSPQVFAQTAVAPNPGLVPPAAPGQPASFATIGALPSLVPAPGTLSSILATPVPTPRVFRCSCVGAPGKTSWIGPVPSSSYFLASQAAVKQCVSYKTNANAPSPYIGQKSTGFSSAPFQEATNAYNSAALLGNSISDSAITINPQGNALFVIEQQCAHCFCN